MRPGEILTSEKPIILNEGKETVKLKVKNTSDRPIQVGSHFHFFETNRDLAFDREKAYGFRLDLPAGTAIRFESGQTHEVNLVALGGRRRAYGLNGLSQGQLNRFNKNLALQRAAANGFKMTEEE